MPPLLELYPARPDRRTEALRLGLAVDGSTARPPLPPGRHQRVDPDGRTVEIGAFGSGDSPGRGRPDAA